MFSFILIFFAAMFNAVMDKTKDTIQFDSSIFHKKNPLFWNDQAWAGEFVPLTEYKANAWHISKSLMLFCLIGLIFHKSVFGWFDYIFLGVEWIIIFKLFYNKIFNKKA